MSREEDKAEAEKSRLQSYAFSKIEKEKRERKITDEDKKKHEQAMKAFQDHQRTKGHKESFLEIDSRGHIVDKSDRTRR